MQLFAKAAEVSGKVLSKVKVNSPTELAVVGTVALVGAIVMAHRAGRKCEEVIEVNKEQIQNLKEIKEAGQYIDEEGNEIEFTEKDYRGELVKSYASFTWDMTKLYGPVVVLGVGSASAYISGHKILAKRLAGATALYLATEDAFKKYRGNVVKVFDEETDKKLYYGLTDKITEEYREIKVDEKTGEEKEVGKVKKRDVDILPQNGDIPSASMYAVWADDCYTIKETMKKNSHYAMDSQLPAFENMANTKLHLNNNGIISLYEIYEMLGCSWTLSAEKKLMSQEVGWVNGVSDSYIKFNVITVRTEKLNDTGELVPCNRVLIDFNCPGSIRKQIEQI